MLAKRNGYFVYHRGGGGGQGSVVGIATRNEVKRPGTHSRWGLHFPLRSRPALGPIRRPVDYRGGPGLVLWGKADGTWR
jgi:hypothetical protein